MFRLALFGAAALAVAALSTPASAQQVIYDPGYCAQFYPNANCNNKGPNNPYTGDYQRRGGTSGPLGFNNSNGSIDNDGYDYGNERRVRRGRYSYNRGHDRDY